MKNTIKGILIIVVSVLVILLVVPRIVNFVRYFGESDEEMYDYKYTAEEIEANYDETPSDIEGWTMGDKVRAGLQPIEGVDSDADGLTDKDEIEVYGSDPSKMSTAGDLYTDGFKVANAMDLNTFYERNDVTFDSNECNEVILTANEASDLYAHVSSEDVPKLDGYTTYKAYDLYYYANTFSIDVSDIITNEGISSDDITILIGHWYGGEMWSAKQSVSGNVVTPDYTFDKNNRYTIVIAKKNGIFSPKNPTLDLTFDASGDDIELNENVNFLYTHTLGVRNLFVNAKPRLYYVPTGDAVADQNTINYLLAVSIYAVDGYGLEGLSDADIKKVSEARMNTLKGIVHSFPLFGLTKANPYPNIQNLLYMWNDEVIIDSDKYKAEVVDGISTRNSHTGFSVYEDAFPFQNFATEYATGGNCAGIAYYTAKLYNEGSMPTSGSYSSSKYMNGAENVTWDISGDTANSTLADKGIFDYKNEMFVSKHKGDNRLLTGLTSGETEFTKMIGAYWAQTNDTIKQGDNLYIITDDIGVYSWDMIEEMKRRLDNGQILILGLVSTSGSGHAINIVDYKTSSDGEKVFFILYDNLFPQNAHKGFATDNILVVTKKTYPEGVAESFTYYYKPYKTCKYEYNSEYSEVGYKSIMVADSNLNIIK